jgi:hypothetical protein
LYAGKDGTNPKVFWDMALLTAVFVDVFLPSCEQFHPSTGALSEIWSRTSRRSQDDPNETLLTREPGWIERAHRYKISQVKRRKAPFQNLNFCTTRKQSSYYLRYNHAN